MNWRIARRLLSLFWPAGEPALRVRVVAALLLILGSKLTSIAAPLFYKRIVDGLSSPSVAIVPAGLILAYGAAHFGSQIAAELRQLLFAPVAQRALRLTALEVFRHLHALSLRVHLDRRTGGLTRIVERGVSAVEFLLDLILFNIVPALLELLLVGFVLSRLYSLEFAAAVLLTIILYAGFTGLVTIRQVQLRRETNSLDVAASTIAVDSLLNYETVKYFSADAAEAQRYDRAKRDYERSAVRTLRWETLLALGQALIIGVGLIVVMLMAARQVSEGRMSTGDLVLVVSYLLQLYAPLGMLGMMYTGVRQALTNVEAMVALLGRSPDIVDRPGAPPLQLSAGRVDFKQVWFAYDERRPILQDVSFEIGAGKKVALVGPTGSGKSTVARLLFRFYDVHRGTILIDGQDIRDVTQESLRDAIAVVPQDTVLFNDTLLYNIAYGRPGASREQVEHAARLAQLHRFVLRMPERYETRVGERGLKLSGGEKQRVAIARAILKDPGILIFDEATSALDSRTEHDIQESLRTVARDRSTLVIAHRLSTVVDADEILVLEHGRIVQRGTHRELLASGGLYASLWKRQLSEAEAEQR